MTNVIVRQATVEDVSELAELRRAFTYEDPSPGEPRTDYEDAFRGVVGDGIRSGSWVVWVAESSGRIVGHAYVALVHKVPRPVEAPRLIGYLTNVYTQPSHRSQGIGGRLLDAVTSWAQRSGLELLIVWPSEESVSLYLRHGFASGSDPLVWANPTTV